MFAISTSGCAVALVAAAAGGTYTMVQGSAEGFSGANYKKIWNQAKKVIKKKGTLLSEDEVGGELKGKVYDVDVTIEVKKITDKSTKIRVTARKNLLPKEGLAQEIYTDIFKNIKK